MSSSRYRVSSCLALTIALCAATTRGQSPPRARDLGIALGGQPGRYNAITDVDGVAVGHVTLITGSGRLRRGEGPVRTGVTAILPRGQAGPDSVFAAWYSLNGNGEMTGIAWLQESGILDTPIVITNTHSVGVARDAVIEWMLRHRPGFSFALPVVAETADGALNDMNGFHVRKEHVFEALDAARGGNVAEGNVGGGTGMICHLFKGGIGTASRVLPAESDAYTVGVLVQCNYGQRTRLRIDGVPVGEELAQEYRPCLEIDPQAVSPRFRRLPPCDTDGDEPAEFWESGQGSIIIIVATDAPLLPHQLKRLARRALAWRGPDGRVGRKLLRRYLPRLLDRQSGSPPVRHPGRHPDAPQQSHERFVSGGGRGHRGSHPQRPRHRRDDERRRRATRLRAPSQPNAGDPEPVRASATSLKRRPDARSRSGHMNPYDVVANDFDAARLGFAEKRFVTATVKELPPGALILDLGCGSGQPITRYLTERGFAVIGVDSSRRMLALARKHVPRARLVRADIQWLALKASFHAIVAWDSLFHVAREHHPTVFRRCCQWLHPGGRLLVSLGGSEWEGMAPMFGKSFFYSGYAPETAIAQLEAAGLRVDFWEVDDATSRGHIAVVARKPA